MRVYRPPVFNLVGRIWFNALPADLADWNGFAPNRDADVTTACQLYLPRDGMGRWHHAISDNALSTVLRTGWQELRCPKGSQLMTVWGASMATTWNQVSLVEVPSGSGRLYAMVIAETKHSGFPNEYEVGILAQLKDNSRLGQLAIGTAVDAAQDGSGRAADGAVGFSLSAAVEPGSPPVNLPIGFALAAFWFPSLWLPSLGIATALHGSVKGVNSSADLAAGMTIASVVFPHQVGGDLATGMAIEGKIAPGKTGVDLAAGMAIEASITSGGGGGAGGPDCNGAVAIGNPYSENITLVAGVPQWFKITVAFGLYHVRLTPVSGTGATADLMFGVCPTPGQWGSIASGGTQCQSSSLGPGTIYIKVIPGMGAGVVNLAFGTGNC